MTDLDLTSIVEATTRAVYEAAPGDGPAWEDLPTMYRHQAREVITDILGHAAPVIETQVREQLAADIEAWRDRETADGILTRGAWADGVRYGIATAADIARQPDLKPRALADAAPLVVAPGVVSPDCRVGKCRACSGDGGWDDELDALAPCAHDCHMGGGS